MQQRDQEKLEPNCEGPYIIITRADKYILAGQDGNQLISNGILLFEVILCVSHIMFNEKIIFYHLSLLSNSDIFPDHSMHCQPSIRVFTLTVALWGLPERWRFTQVGCLEPAYNKIYPDGCPSRSTAYTGLNVNDDPSWGFLKDKAPPRGC